MKNRLFCWISLFLLRLAISNAKELTSYERSFTPYEKNLSCYVCEPASINLTDRTYVQWEIENKRCEEPSEDLIQKCEETEDFKPRGCGKLVTKSYQHINLGGEKEVILFRRFCASTGMNKDEQKCIQTMSQGRWTEVCVCGGNACNGVEGHQKITVLSIICLILTFFAQVILFQ
ncbi:unnamed protein product [Hymenolepis diminuta]|uniref:Protein quiver n=1 Tax=Hymenolepis diminuta TaxID=6216 RepID=A0A564Z978_HYMDI|nr:unnamed protein product [Hymenolepis diminuta]